jgi:hypothetical protein
MSALRRLAVAFVFALALAAPAPAGAAPTPRAAVAAVAPAPPLAASFRAWLSSLTTRERVIQIAVLGMCLALFILMKKLTP